MNLFHVAPIPLGVGSVIEPGNFGRLMTLNDAGSFAAHREAVFECIRAKNFIDKPSRLESIFCCLDEESIREYRTRFAPLGICYEVELIDLGKPVHIAPISLVITRQQHVLPVSALEQAANSYWAYSVTNDLIAGSANDLIPIISHADMVPEHVGASLELLTPGSIRIVRRLDT